jgi:hypothetical protein
MTLDQECFLEHLASSAFENGIERGWWSLVASEAVVWPYSLLWISMPERPNSPGRLHLHFHLKDYPTKGPTATPWSPENNTRLDLARWPKGKGNVAIAFRTGDDWRRQNPEGLYVPWDRIPAVGHPNWPTDYPGFVWQATYTIVHYLRWTRELLDSNEYTGC